MLTAMLGVVRLMSGLIYIVLCLYDLILSFSLYLNVFNLISVCSVYCAYFELNLHCCNW